MEGKLTRGLRMLTEESCRFLGSSLYRKNLSSKKTILYTNTERGKLPISGDSLTHLDFVVYQIISIPVHKMHELCHRAL